MIPISLTLGNKGLFCALESQLINSPLSEPEQANGCSASTELWMTRALCSSQEAPFLTYFLSLKQTGKCGQKRSGNGAAWGTEAPLCVCPRTYSIWHRRSLTTDSTTWQSRNAGSNRKICLQSLNFVAKLLLWCVGAWGNSEDDEWSYSWATAVTTEEYTSLPVPAVYQPFTSEMKDVGYSNTAQDVITVW